MKKDLYTAVVEFEGNTWIFQYHIDELSAIIGCLEKDLSEQGVHFDYDTPNPIRDRISVWCMSTINSRDNLVLVNIVKTKE